VVVLDIYAASEPPIEGITSQALVRQISEQGKPAAAYASSFADGVAKVAAAAQPGDMILTLGAGSVSQLGPMILAKLQESEAASSAPQAAVSTP
jgi:UDP-N-acetylmuramate--alanine ligase